MAKSAKDALDVALPAMTEFAKANKCDAYVVVAVGDETRKSKTVIRSYNPVFNERLVFSVPPLVDRVALTIYDYEPMEAFLANKSANLAAADARWEGWAETYGTPVFNTLCTHYGY